MGNDYYYAHIRPDPDDLQDVERWTFQKVEEHCRQTSRYAERDLEEVGLSASAALLGLLHDMGKEKEEYQDYLRDSVMGKKAVRGSVNHTFAAVRYLLERYHDGEKWGDYGPLTAELLACAAGSHHGLFDVVDDRHRSGFQHRLEKAGIGYEEAKANFLEDCAGEKELDCLFSQAVKETETFYARLLALLGPEPDGKELEFYEGLWMRLLLSALISGDRRDSGEFMDRMQYPKQLEGEKRRRLWTRLSARVDEQLDKLPRDTAIRQARGEISRRCRQAALEPGGVYRLNVPTGAGKTLSGLRFALAHAARWNKSRIIFTSPLLSVLEQNLSEVKKYIGEDELILEHHSNVVRERDPEERLDPTQLLTQTWDAPIIVTTMVQLLNALFDGSGSCIRRFSSLCSSVIVIDEVQTVPGNLLSLFHLAVNFLSGACGATIVLCSATQPCSEAALHPITIPTREMVPYDPKLWPVFCRTRIVDAGAVSLEGIPALAAQMLEGADSLLVICNKKDQAGEIYRSLPGDYLKFHLSAAMCMAHRSDTLKAMRAALDDTGRTQKLVCVSTQVIEAGVDISFARVIRLAAGMDSVVQSAGRCNRNGESQTPAPVGLVRCAGENLKRLPDIQRAKNATLALLGEFQARPERFNGDLASDQSIAYYYRKLFHELDGIQDGPVMADGRQTSLYELLSLNENFVDLDFDSCCEKFALRQAFRTAGRYFAVFDRQTTDILVPYKEEGRRLISDFGAVRLPYDIKRVKELLEEAKPYTVSVYEWQRAALEQQGALIPLCGGAILALQEGYYDDKEIGLLKEQQDPGFLGV